MNGWTSLMLWLLAVSAVVVEGNWKNRKNQHVSVRSLDGVNVNAYGNDLKNEDHYRRALRKILIPRVPGTPGSEKVRQFIVDEMRALDWDVELVSSEQSTPHGVKPFHNIIATLDPEAPRRLVLACHYDSLSKPDGFLGATDSAVPCAQMLNLAYTMRRDLALDKSKTPELTLQLIFFDGEEAFKKWRGTDNTYGARDLATKWNDLGYTRDGVTGTHNERIDLFVLLDLIGSEGFTFLALQRPTKHWYERLVRIENQLDRLNSFHDSNNRRGHKQIFIDPRQKAAFGAAVEDDHIPFMRKGVPILHLICVPFPDEWHKRGDDGTNIDHKRVADLNKILRVFVAEYLQLQEDVAGK